jgi:ammonium transporter Rh
MLLVGFGFLMVFVRDYARSALTATFLLVSVAIPLYLFVNRSGVFGAPAPGINGLVLAEFAGASLLICVGAVLGRLKMWQYLLLGLLFIPCYMFNEWILASGGFGLIAQGVFVDTGGSIIIHAFGAIFGLGVILTMTSKKEYDTPIQSDKTSELFSILGSMMLWIFWPGSCAALVPAANVPHTVINVALALSGSTLATYVGSVAFQRKIATSDIANAALAGGVAIGASCMSASPGVALLIGVLAGSLSVVGFAVIAPWLTRTIKKVDTCGVMYLHGLPGLLGGIAALFALHGLDCSADLIGIGLTIGVALLSGFVVGKILLLFGRRATAYSDAEEFLEAEA